MYLFVNIMAISVGVTGTVIENTLKIVTIAYVIQLTLKHVHITMTKFVILRSLVKRRSSVLILVEENLLLIVSEF